MFGTTENHVAAALTASAELERIRSVLESAVAASDRGNRLQGSRALPVQAGRALLWGGSGRLMGWSLRAAGGAVTLTLRDGRDDTADPVAVINIAADATSNHQVPAASFNDALWLQRSGAGTLEGAVWIGAVD